MKQLLLLFFSVSVLGTVFSQPYQSIYGDSTTLWSLIKIGQCDAVCSDFYSPSGDTIIGFNTYEILPNYGFIREDSTVGKVWFYDDYWGQEFLVMDLSLNPADTFIIYDWNGTADPFFVDSITYNLGKKHVYLTGGINICGMSETLIFVEGSGPNAGFNYQRTNAGNDLYSYMLCHEKDSIKVQGNTMFMDSCEVCMVGIEELTITSKQLIKIVDLMGRETPFKPNAPLIYIYSDGTTEKVFRVE